ncbi:hypothetical protein SLEP1_g637 [Rubroshorea leprosula]|uniref:Uncharacterized protein n=1 Tax=Rubroshorea leprosula TaxID=152421 RepID=A0AAV5HI50_9ROSI|nr:hypothetical protein SLEP1_g637 [Rubroshorea leprosula]
MHGCDSGSALVVNAEVDSMGGVVDGGVGIGVKTSPRRAAIEKAQAELRQEYDVREERRRELEFLEKGGNPLDFKFGNAASLSVQSTSLTDQQAEHFVTSEAKGSFALTASPHGDSVESSGRPGVLTVCEHHTADNLILFDHENELHEGKRNSMHRSKRSSVAPSEQSSQMDGTQNAKESEDSAIFRPYARRNRSKINRDSARSSSTDMVQSRGGHGSSLPARGGSKDVKAPISETNNQKEQNVLSISNPRSVTSNGDLVSKKITSDNQLNAELDNMQTLEVTTSMLKGEQSDECKLNTPSKSLTDVQQKELTQVEPLKSSNKLASDEPDGSRGKEQVISAGLECPSGAAATNSEKEISSSQLNGFSESKRERRTVPTAGQQNSNAAIGAKRLDSESSCTQNSLNLDVNNDNDMCITKNVDANGKSVDQTSELEVKLKLPDGNIVQEKNEIKPVDDTATINEKNGGASQDHSLNDPVVKVDEEIRSDMQNEMGYPSNVKGFQQNDCIASEAEMRVSNVSGDHLNSRTDNCLAGKPQGMVDISISDLPKTPLLVANDAAATDPQIDSDKHLKVMDKEREDSILEEARIIEAKRKRIAELSVGSLPSEHCRKSHWDFVLEEMAWLANDFAQERLWKMTAAAQISRRIAFASHLRFDEQSQQWKQKKVALSLANSVMQFWHSVQLLLNNEEASVSLKNSGHGLVGSGVADTNEVSKDKAGELDLDTSKEFDQKHPRKNIEGYALRFLKYNSSPFPSQQAEAPATPDRMFDWGIMEMSWAEHLTEESLLYAVPPGSIEAYRKSIESYLVQTEKTGSGVQDEVETSAYDAGAEFRYHVSAYDEDEGETSTYYIRGSFEASKSSKANQKNRKHLNKSYTRPYEMGAELTYGNCAIRSQQSMLLGKRPANSLNAGSIPTKRVRTGSRHNRVISPFNGAAPPGILQTPAKTDASSGDTNSFQDDQSTFHGGSQIQKSMEVESIGDYERHLPYDSAETPRKPKKKKLKHPGSGYDQGWPLESTIHNEQRDHSRKRFELHHFDSNGTSGLYVQHNAKKPKIIKQHPDGIFDMTPSGSIPSPVASQVSNMSNPNKLIKIIGGRDRGRKPKGSKITAGQPGPGSSWSLFEDQALVVLVHDMGPNWELVSDAINSTVQFKCIFRTPKECKERHKNLMDRSGDGADSADDSGSSQSYPSTLPGIPKGSARQLFQRLQGPMEEDTLKSHFENIIKIGKKQHYQRTQDTKQMVPVHNSHSIALSQVCQNNLNGLLTPLDLCEATGSGQDGLPIGYQPPHSSSLAVSNQGAVGSVLSASGANSPLQSSAMVLGNNMSSPSPPLNTSIRDGRYGVPQMSLPADEQHRMQQYNQMLSGRNIQQSNSPASGVISGSDRGVRMLPGGNGMGIMSGTNRSMPVSRTGFQGMASSSMLNTSSMLSSNVSGIPSVNMHSGPGPSQGNSMLRPRDAMHMIRSGHNPEHQRQLMVPELQMQATQGTSRGIPAFSGLSSGFPNQTTMPTQAYPGHPHHHHQQPQHQIPSQQSHAMSNSHHPHLQGPNVTGPQPQPYAMRLVKERQIQQQRLMQQQQQQQPQQQQQFAASSSLMPHVQPQSQLPISSSLQNNSQIQSQASNQSVTPPSLTSSSPMAPVPSPHQQKHHLPPHNLTRISQSGTSGLTNQMVKQRQRQPQQQQQFQQSGRNHPQQRQQIPSQQQAKISKGMGRVNMLMHHSGDPSPLNGLSMAPGNQTAEKGEHIMHLVQGQGFYSASGMSPVQPSKPLVPSQSSNHPQPQQKSFSGTPPSKQTQQMPPHSENSTQGQVSAIPSGHSPSAAHQALLPTVVPSNHQHLHLQSQPHQKQANQTQPTIQRVLQHNRSTHPDPSNISQAEPQADQQPVTTASLVGATATAAMPQVSNDSANAMPVVSSAAAPQWKATEPGHDSGMPNMAAQMGSIGSSPFSNSAGSDPVTSASQGLGQRQLSGGLLPQGHNAGAQWQQQPHIQSPTPQPSQQHYHSQEQVKQDQHQSAEQLPPQQQSHQQIQHLQAVQSSLYHKPSNYKTE